MKNKNSRVEILRHFDRLPTFTRRDVNLFDRRGHGSLLTSIINYSRDHRYINIEVIEAHQGQHAEDFISQIEQWQNYSIKLELIRDSMVGITTIENNGQVAMKCFVSLQPSFLSKGLDFLIDELAADRRAIERIEEERQKLARCRGKLFQMNLD